MFEIYNSTLSLYMSLGLFLLRINIKPISRFITINMSEYKLKGTAISIPRFTHGPV